ncbi:hypothetical protein DM860_007791 [Cuscuta australis]|uniref:Ubiquitin-like protease family profile domain-containing protein n=1 Tax=Cuscuta australis TaxID=267555 RepID=A0A328DWK3_9ASTE|nr:hypothetical protein DM860_007791 [Cuscuta australis]
MEVLKYNDVILRPSDIDVLENPCFLNDQVIAFYFSYLSSLCSEDDIAFVPPVVSFWLANCDAESRKDAVEPLKLGSKRLVLFTVNNNEDLDKGEGGTHWSILIFDRTKNSFLHLDTLKGVNHAHAFKLYDSVKQYVGVPSASIKERVKNKNKNKKKSKAASVPATEVTFEEWTATRQINNYDCGVYVMAVAKAVSDFYLCDKPVKERDWLSFVARNVDDSVELGTFRQEIRRLIEDLRNSH